MAAIWSRPQCVNTIVCLRLHYGMNCIIWLNAMRPTQNGQHFADNIFKCIFLNGDHYFTIKIPSSLFLRVQIRMSQHWSKWCLGLKKPLTESVMTQLWPQHRCFTSPQWVNKHQYECKTCKEFYFITLVLNQIQLVHDNCCFYKG